MVSRFSNFLSPLARGLCLLTALGSCVALGALYLGPADWHLPLALATAGLLLVTSTMTVLNRQRDSAAMSSLPPTSIEQGRALLDASGTILDGDEGLAVVLGRPLGKLLNQPLRRLLPETLWTDLLKRSQRARATQTPLVLEINVPRANDAASPQPTQQLRCVFEAHQSSAGDHQWVLTMTDVSRAHGERVAAQERLQDLTKALHQSAEFSFEIAANGQLLSGNAETLAYFGWRRDSKLPLLTDLTLGPATTIEAKLHAALETGKPIVLKPLRLRGPSAPTGSPAILELEARLQRLPIASGPDHLLLTGVNLTTLLGRQRKLLSRSQRLEAIYQSNPEAIILFRDSDGEVLDCNPGLTALLGYDLPTLQKQCIAGRNLWSNELERQSAQKLLAQTGGVAGLRAAFRHRDGSTVIIELNLRTVAVGGEACTLCSGHDISDQIAQDNKLRMSEEKFQRMFQGSPDATAIVRLHDGVIVEVNPAVGQLVGTPPKALVGQSCFDRDFSLLNVDAQKLFAVLEPNSKIRNAEVTINARNGTPVPAIASATMIELEGEQHLLFIARDLRELRSVEDRLQRIEARFRGAFENAQLALLLVDMEGRIFETNNFARDLLSFTEAQFDGLHVSRLLPPEDRTRLKSALGELQNRGQGTIRSERRLLCQNGLELWTNFQVILQKGVRREDSYFIIQATDITDIKVSQRRMERMAFYDTLTDLANRRLFADRLRQAAEHSHRHGGTAALLYLDLDQFKRVNDTLGHEAGDTLLQEVAHRLMDCVRSEDTVGRMGGDEFTVLLYDVQHAGDAGVVATKILKRLNEPVQISGHQLVVSASIGVTVLPGDGTDPTALLKNADLAMYRAKERGRNNFQFFSSDMNAQATRLLRTENELRTALERSEFVLHHQPKYRIEDGTLAGVECLVRWNHPERGLVGPGEFIDVAEETGAIVPLGSWIIEAACEAAKTFAELSDRNFVTAVNISPRQFRDPNLVNTIRRCLRTHDLTPDKLQVEITETMLMQDVAAAEMTVARLHELGIQLAIDDFGTGYSSLNYLKRFPINTVKVDRSFVKDIPGSDDDCAITAAVIAMAHRLQMEVVAEGVETDEQIAFLRDHECEYAQGFRYSKPITMEAMRLTIQRDNLRNTPKTLVNR